MRGLASDMNAYVMGFFLSLSIINVWENTNTFLSRRMKLDALQWASASSQLLNLILVSFGILPPLHFPTRSDWAEYLGWTSTLSSIRHRIFTVTRL